jgi:hypothetical protein
MAGAVPAVIATCAKSSDGRRQNGIGSDQSFGTMIRIKTGVSRARSFAKTATAWSFSPDEIGQVIRARECSPDADQTS